MPSANTGAVAGGTLTGLGRGLANRAERDHRDALLLREQALEFATQLRRDMILQQEREAERGLRREELADRRTERAEDRADSIALRTADRTEASIQRGLDRDAMREEREADREARADVARINNADEGGGMSAGEQRAWNAAVQRNTTSGGLGREETVDWAKVAADLKDQGFPKLAQLAMSDNAPDPGMDINSGNYAEAKRLADEEIGAQAGWLSSDAKDFKEYGGNRERARSAKTEEHYNRLSGRRPASNANADTPPQDAAATAATGTPPGSGTEADPYKPTSQAQYDSVPKPAPSPP